MEDLPQSHSNLSALSDHGLAFENSLNDDTKETSKIPLASSFGLNWKTNPTCRFTRTYPAIISHFLDMFRLLVKKPTTKSLRVFFKALLYVVVKAVFVEPGLCHESRRENAGLFASLVCKDWWIVLVIDPGGLHSHRTSNWKLTNKNQSGGSYPHPLPVGGLIYL